MGSNTCLVYLMVLCTTFLISHATRDITLSKEELEWEKEFELMKKPSIKVIKTDYGDIYDCVDFYKQPAFDHPLLKNHTFYPQMRPSTVIKANTDGSSSRENVVKLDDIKFKDGCPTGTVPTRRVSKDEFMEIKRFTRQYASRTKLNGIQPQPGTHFAIAQSKSGSSRIYYGLQSQISIHNPSVKPNQYSSAEMILQSGTDSIQVGWTVNPTLYKDNLTRFFQYLNAGQSHCFNTLCPGFVSVRQDIPIDFVIRDITVFRKRIYYMPIFVYQDEKNGNWWLQVGKESTAIGFWPQKIFTSLAKSASYIAVGGEAYGPPNQPMGNERYPIGSLPPMGAGHYPSGYFARSAFCRSVFVLDENHKPARIDTIGIERYTDIENYGVYTIEYSTKNYPRTIYYGGPRYY